MGVVGCEIRQADCMQRLFRRRIAGAVCVAAVELEGEADVVERVAPGQQGGVLEDEPDAFAPLELGGGAAVQGDVALAGVKQAADGAQQGGLAAAAWAYQRDKRALRYV